MESRLLDRATLLQEIEAIFEGASGNFPSPEIVLNDVETVVQAGRQGEVQPAAERVIALLSLDLEPLRKAALLSLMVRLTGKRKFDPVANYVLEKRAAYVTSQG
jgi:hypothetical protein